MRLGGSIKAERAGDGFKLGHHHAGYGGEGARLAGLGDAHVGPDAKQDEGVFEAQAPLAREEVCGLAAGLAHGVGVLDCRAVGDPGPLGLAHGPGGLLALQEVEADRNLARYLDAGAADLAVSHARVHVPDAEHPAGLAHGKEDLRSYSVQVVVEVAAVPARHGVGDVLTARRHTDHADHRPHGKLDLMVEMDDAVVDGENLGDGRFDYVYELAELRDDGGYALRAG